MTEEQDRTELGDLPVVWDDQALVRTLGHAQKEVHHRMLERFAMHTGKQILQLRHLAEQGDLKTMGMLAHNAKTAARTVGAMQLGHLCEQLEYECVDGNLPLALQRVVEVLRAYDAIQNHLPPPNSAS